MPSKLSELAAMPAASYAVPIFFFVIALVLLAGRLRRLYYDPREPPIPPSKIPIIGPMIGLMRNGGGYFKWVHQKHNLPIFTIPSVGINMYFVNSPQVAAQVYRASKTLSFEPLMVETSRRLALFGPNEIDIMEGHAEREKGNRGLMPVMLDHFSKGLGVGGSTFRELTGSVLAKMAEAVNQVPIEGREVELLEWARKAFSLANMHAFFGPQHLMATDPGLEDDFWEFQSAIVPMMANFFPSYTVPKAVAARQRLFEGMLQYFRENRHEQASSFIQKRYKIYREHGLSLEKAAHSDVPLLIAILVNAAPASFWVIVNIFSRPALLSEIRAELEPLVEVSGGVRKLSAEAVQKNCPLMVSTYRETMRFVGIPMSTRIVLKDTMIDDGRYLLKKDCLVQVATSAIHTDESIWGPDVADFDPRRFMADRNPKSTPALYSFGGGATLCPGRHYAMTEILGFAAAIVLSLDINRTGDGDERLPIVAPARNEKAFPIGTSLPVGTLNARIRRREGLSGPIDLQP